MKLIGVLPMRCVIADVAVLAWYLGVAVIYGLVLQGPGWRE